jgi:hypothetical protein
MRNISIGKLIGRFVAPDSSQPSIAARIVAPREAGAFDAGREFAHAGEDFQAAQVVLFGFWVEVAFGHPVEFVEHHC